MSSDKPLVALDIGNVLCRVDFEEFQNMLWDKEIVPTIYDSMLFLERIQPEHDVGLITMAEALEQLTSEMSHVHELLDAWERVVTLSNPMLALVEELKKERRVALLSNVGKEHSKVFRNCPAFDGCIQHFSCEVGARKPSKLFFQSFHIEHGWKGIWRSNGRHENYSSFFDDRQENVDAAQMFFKGQLFSLEDYDDDEDASAALREMLTAADEPC